jgi:hypothetical protein
LAQVRNQKNALINSSPECVDIREDLPLSVEKFLKQRAVNVAVVGNYTLPNWFDPQGRLRTFACRTSRVSPFRMMVDVPVVGKVGDRLSAYFQDFGKFDASITDTQTGLFLLELEMTRPMREKFASKLTWLEKKQKEPGIPDLRKDARIIPTSPHSTLTLADGTTQGCFVIDMSSSGVAISAQLQPQIGTPLAVGACIGRVVRLLPDGFAVKFVDPLNRNELERRLVTRSAPRASADSAPGGPRSSGVLPVSPHQPIAG